MLKGEYGATPAPVDAALQARVLEGAKPVTCRPADLLEPELEAQATKLRRVAAEEGFRLAADEIDDVLTFALFPQIGTMFLKNRGNPAAFEPAPWDEPAAPAKVAVAQAAPAGGPAVYRVKVNGKAFTVEVAESGQVAAVAPASGSAPAQASGGGDAVKAVLAGNIFKVNVAVGDTVKAGEPLLIVEAMKMETAVAAPRDGKVTEVFVKQGDTVAVGDPLVAIG